ncbi:MAG: MFS transporter [Chloroflexota bacterium]
MAEAALGDGEQARMSEVRAPSLAQRIIYSTGALGAGSFNAFFNSTLPLFLTQYYALPFWLMGLVAQERSFFGSLLEPVVGWLSDRTRTRFGRRRPYLLVGAPLAGIGLIIVSQVPPVWALVLVLLFLPFMLAISNVPYRAMLADIASPQVRGGIAGLVALMEMLGNIGLVLLARWVYDQNQSLGIVFYAIAVALILSFLGTFLFVREPALPALPPKPADGTGGRGQGERVSPSGLLRQAGRYLAGLTALGEAGKWVVSLFFFWFALGGISPFVTRYAAFELGLGEGTALNLFLYLVLFTAIFAVPVGIAGDRLGKKKVIGVGLLLFAAAALAGSRVNTEGELRLVLIVAGAANAAVTALGFAFLTELLPRRRMGELTGISGMIWSFAQPLGSLSLGALADVTGTLRTTLLVAAIGMFISFAILLFVRPERAGMEE